MLANPARPSCSKMPLPDLDGVRGRDFYRDHNAGIDRSSWSPVLVSIRTRQEMRRVDFQVEHGLVWDRELSIERHLLSRLRQQENDRRFAASAGFDGCEFHADSFRCSVSTARRYFVSGTPRAFAR